ncbi:MAG: hypothetical protein QOJ90_1667 [Actinomycetota bacterium]|jgi:hypothetical protein|nr:hypothetical protein [Actinomycetota bacterium]
MTNQQRESETAPPERLVRACLAVSAILMLSGVIHLAIALGDDRPWSGPLSWRKPATFGLSFGLTLATITWVSSYLVMSARTRAALLAVFAGDCIVEVAGITVQAWRHVPSHLNTSTPVNAAIAYTLAAGGGVLVVVLSTLAVIAFRGRVNAAPDMRLALRAGFVLLLCGLASGVAMIARGTVVMRSGDTARAYDVAGFLKDFHGVTLHGILVLPALAWWLARRDVPPRPRRLAVVAAVAGYAVAAGAVLAWTLVTRL